VEAADFERIGVDEVKVFRVRLSERVVSWFDACISLLFSRKKQREVFYPKKSGKSKIFPLAIRKTKLSRILPRTFYR
jgi:hypothetical protein